MSSKPVKWIAGFAIVAVCGAAGAWGTTALLKVSGSEQETGEEEQASSVMVESPMVERIEDRADAVGTILALRSVELRPLSEGRVTEVPVASGAKVTTGDTILQLDPRAAQADLSQAQATFEEAEAEFDRYRRLEDENVAAEARLEEARGGFDRARAALDATQAVLDDRTLTAPFDGVLGFVDVDPGAFVDPTSVVTTLDDLSSVEAEFSLPERLFDRVRTGQTVRLRAAAYPDRTFEGEVSIVAPTISPETRSFQVRVLITNDDRALTSGMFVRAELVFETFEADTLPQGAIISEGNATYVYTVQDGTATRTGIEIGGSSAGRTEVRSGLPSDARVVVAGWDTLTDGAPVEVREPGEDGRQAAAAPDDAATGEASE